MPVVVRGEGGWKCDMITSCTYVRTHAMCGNNTVLYMCTVYTVHTWGMYAVIHPAETLIDISTHNTQQTVRARTSLRRRTNDDIWTEADIQKSRAEMGR